jgi:GGDEF domain-containing protein
MFPPQFDSLDRDKSDVSGEALVNILVVKEDHRVIVKKLGKEPLTIGRGAIDDIPLRSRGISRCHATVYVSDGAPWIIDGSLKGRISTNGLFVNGRKVTVHRLNQYDIIGFHKEAYAFFLSHQDCGGVENSLEDVVRNLAYFVSGKTIEGTSLEQLNLLNDTSQATLTNAEQVPLLDSLTRLPNRESFFFRVKKSLELRKEISQDYNFAVLFIDVDRFKMINDSLGHLIGDEFLIRLAKRLGRCLRGGDMVARLGGDEFAILLDDLHSPVRPSRLLNDCSN